MPIQVRRVSPILSAVPPSSARIIRAVATTSSLTLPLLRRRLPPGDRQAYYGSFTRDICDKYLTVFGDFKYARSYFDSSLAAAPFTPDPFKGTRARPWFSPERHQCANYESVQSVHGCRRDDSRYFLMGIGLPVTTGVRFRPSTDTGPRSEKFTYWDQLFDIGMRVSWGMLAITSRRGIGNWVSGTRAMKDRIFPLAKSVSPACAKPF